MNGNSWQTWMQSLRRHPLPWGVGGLILVALVVVWVVRAHRAGVLPGGRFQVVGFYENKSPGDPTPSSWASFSNHWRSLTTVSPRWFSVQGNGTVADIGYDARVATFARQHHVALVPLFTNVGSAMLDSATLRRTTAANIARIVKADRLNGVNLDFELLPAGDRAALTALVEDVRRDVPTGDVVAVSVFPLVGLPASINGADDYPALAHWATYLVIMAYDHHYSGGPPGPVAPYGWVAANVRQALTLVPAKKLVLAIGMYGYDWVNTGAPGPAATVSDVEAEALARQHNIHPLYDAAISQNHFTYVSGGVSHVVWYMGDRSASARIALARDHHLAGVALWRLGDEDPRFWRALAGP
jgi:spore germination protein